MEIMKVSVAAFLLWNSCRDIRKKEIVPLSIGLFTSIRLIYFLIQIFDMGNCFWEELFHLVVGAIPGAVLYMIGKVSKGTVGMGDGMILAVTGLYIGIKDVMEVIMCGFFLAGLWCGVCLLLKKYRWKSRIPLVPFLLCGYCLCFII